MLEAMNRGHTVPTDFRRIVDRAARGAARYRAVLRFHRRLSRRERCRFRGDAARWCARSASRRPTPSNTARGPARRPPRMPARSPEAVKDERLQILQDLLEDAAARFNQSLRRSRRCRCCSRSRAGIRASSSAAPLCCKWVHAEAACSAASSRSHRVSRPVQPQRQSGAQLAWRRGRHLDGACVAVDASADAADRAASICNSTTTGCCRCSSASMTAISRGSSRSSVSRWSRAATTWRSPVRTPSAERRRASA